MVSPLGVLHESCSVNTSSCYLSCTTTLDLYLPPDVDAVLLEVGGVRGLVHVPLGEGYSGVIRPFEQHLVLVVVEADPEHVGGYCECDEGTLRDYVSPFRH